MADGGAFCRVGAAVLNVSLSAPVPGPVMEVPVLDPLGIDPTTGVPFPREPGPLLDPTTGGVIGYVPLAEETDLVAGQPVEVTDWWYAPATGPEWAPSRYPPTPSHTPATPEQIPSSIPPIGTWIKTGTGWAANLVGSTAWSLVQPMMPLVIAGLVGLYFFSKKSAVTIHRNPGKSRRRNVQGRLQRDLTSVPARFLERS